MRLSRLGLAAALAVQLSACASPPVDGPGADRVFLDGAVYTLDPERPWARAVVVDDGRVDRRSFDHRAFRAQVALREANRTREPAPASLFGFEDDIVGIDPVSFTEQRADLLPPLGVGLLCFATGGWSGVVWGFSISTMLLWHATYTINSLAHRFGSVRQALPLHLQ